MNVVDFVANLLLWLVVTTGYKSLQNFSEYWQNVRPAIGKNKVKVPGFRQTVRQCITCLKQTYIPTMFIVFTDCI